MVLIFIDLTACRKSEEKTLGTSGELKVIEVLADREWQEALNKSGEISVSRNGNIEAETTVQILSLKNH